MLPVGWLIVAVAVTILLTMWITFTLTRLDRLHARVDAAWAALDAQLVRRAAALLSAVEAPETQVDSQLRHRCELLSHAALATEDPIARQGTENAVGRAILEVTDAPTSLRIDAHAELSETAARVMIARRFYNDAVRDTRALRARRMPRVLRLAGRRAMPQFFDIDDTVPSPLAAPPQPSRPAPVAHRAGQSDQTEVPAPIDQAKDSS